MKQAIKRRDEYESVENVYRRVDGGIELWVIYIKKLTIVGDISILRLYFNIV